MQNTKRISFKLPAIIAAVFLFCIFGKIHNASAINAPTAPTSTSNIVQSSIQFNWTWGGGDETRYIVERSTNGINYTVVSSSIPTSTTNYTFTGLTQDTRYWFRVAAATSTSATSTYVTSSPRYTLAEITTPVASALTTSTATLNFSGVLNPSSTRYSLGVFANRPASGFNFLGYLDQNGFITSTQVIQATSTWGANFLARGLSPNVLYAFIGNAINGDGTTSSYNTSLSSFARYTLATQVDAPTVGTPTNSSVPITINTTGNSASTTYAIQLFANNYGSSSFLSAAGAVTGTPVYQTTSTWGANFSAAGLMVDYDYQFAVIARNGEGIDAATSSLSLVARTVATAAPSAGGSAIPVNTASQGGVPFNPAPINSPAPIAVPGVPTAPANPPVSPKVIFKTNLALGSKGVEVVALQQKLRELGFFKYATNTGYYGSVTRVAVVAFQKKYNLKPYPGVVGPLTRTTLNSL